MKYGPTILAAFALLLVAYIVFCPGQRSGIGEGVSLEYQPSPASLTYSEPKWRRYARIREVSDPRLGVILGDLESHLPNDHNYTDVNKLTWAHQASHGINAKVRNDPSTREGFNGFYLLQDRLLMLQEPEVSMRDVAAMVPERLRGLTFDVYLDEQSLIWNGRPLYLVDEWVAFSNGADAGRELNMSGWQFELLQAHNFTVYCLYLAMVVQRDCSDYNDADLKELLRWNSERVFRLTYPSEKRTEEQPRDDFRNKLVSNWHICPHQLAPKFFASDLNQVSDYIKIVKDSPEAEKLRKFARDYLGEDWFKRTYLSSDR